MVLGLVVGSIATSITRPPTFDGPTYCQRVLDASGSAAACAAARLSCACVTGAPDDAARSRNDCGPSASCFAAPLHGGGPASACAGALLAVTDVIVAIATTNSAPATSSTTRL